MRLTVVVAALSLGFAATAWAKEPAAPAAPAAAAAKAGAILAPKGEYKLDPHHASLTFKILHFGLSNYTARFTKFDATLSLDPQNLANSSVTATIDPTSIKTDFAGDFQGAHKGSPYKTFEEELAKDPKYLNAGQFGTITFKSTKVEPGKKGHFKLTGDLTFLGQTHPVTLDASVVGSIEKHPYMGVPVVGFSATTTFKRSEWGMTGTQAYLGDDVTIIFEGEFDGAKPAN
jgi:polyisoprenoid-binding protein YceI